MSDWQGILRQTTGRKVANVLCPRRIVTKVDQLMALVDQLETQLAASRATAQNLLDAIVAELTATGSPPPTTPPKKAACRPQPI